MLSVWELPSPLGNLTLAAEDGALVGLWFAAQAHFGGRFAPLPAPSRCAENEAVLTQTEQWLAQYFAGEEPGPLPPLRPAGTPFQQTVWSLLLSVPRRQTLTYGALAALVSGKTGRQTSARAVAGAVGRNPISILIPCHRVVGKAGLTGYAGGLERKRALLQLEGAL